MLHLKIYTLHFFPLSQGPLSDKGWNDNTGTELILKKVTKKKDNTTGYTEIAKQINKVVSLKALQVHQ